jgi:hypothetical protein
MPIVTIDSYRRETFTKKNHIRVSYYDSGALEYDFALRIVRFGRDFEGVLPFSQVDPEVLVTLYDALVEMGGTPPPLPAYITYRVPKSKTEHVDNDTEL